MWFFKDLAKHIIEFFLEAFTKIDVIILIFFFGAFSIYAYNINISFSDILLWIWIFIKYTWWILTLIPLWMLFRRAWLYWRQQLFQGAIRWAIFELKFPLINEKSPVAMEQVLREMHSQRNAPSNFQERWIDGEVTRWYALEMVSFGGEVHFYVRLYAKLSNIFKSAMYAFYPDVEVVAVEDYVDIFPKNLRDVYEQGYDLFGSEMLLVKDPLYPVKTYEEFEDMEETRIIDPLAIFIEILAGIGREDTVAIQVLAAPTGAEWVTDRAEEVKALKQTTLSTDPTKFVFRTPGETSVIEKVEKNMAKPAFDSIVRFIYMGPKSTFFPDFARKGIAGAFQQYNTGDLNAFRPNYVVMTRAQVWDWPHIYIDKRVEFRKQRILYNFINREHSIEGWLGKFISSYWPWNSNFASESIILNTETIATLFHPPTATVLTAPHIKRIESRRAGPPAGMAIFGDESAIQRFKGEE